jgi:flagellin
MSSNITLSSSISQNLYSLQTTQKLMDTTSYRLSTGKKVNSALDDPTNYFSAESNTQRASDLQVRKDGMSEAIETINAANNGIEAITDLIASAKSLAQSALSSDSATDRADYMAQFNELLDQIDDLAADSGYKGVNLLDATSTLDVSFDETGDSKTTLTGTDCDSAGLSLADATAWGTVDAAGNTAINASIALLDTAKSDLRTSAKQLSNKLNTITSRQDFTTKMINTLKEGAANLVNADTTEEGANLTTLQTQQSLATTALSIATQSSQAVLSLFN